MAMFVFILIVIVVAVLGYLFQSKWSQPNSSAKEQGDLTEEEIEYDYLQQEEREREEEEEWWAEHQDD